ncbi:unnamed protein product [Effrenium voratum]|uniref:Fe2OG dioxygenase domain-containing protein n=1 Tax=Effrenium voratum TaxID=2562239 RepID=A0AA36IXQ5_9DINO|nr:unnamed protein product [Effrenium voratum]
MELYSENAGQHHRRHHMCCLRFFVPWIIACSAQPEPKELHVLSSAPKAVQVFWLPGDGHGDGDVEVGQLAAAGEQPSSFSITTYPGHAFYFQAGPQRSNSVAHSGGEHDLVMLSEKAGALSAEVLTAEKLKSLVREMHLQCKGRHGYISCCRTFARESLGIPSRFADRYIESYSPNRWMPKDVGRGSIKEVSPVSLGDEPGAVPEDEMVVVNNLPDSLDLLWVPFADEAKLEESTFISDVPPESFVRISGKPGQMFMAMIRGQNESISAFQYPGELAVVLIRPPEGAPPLRVAVANQDQLKIALSNAAQAFLGCFRSRAALSTGEPLPQALSAAWFVMLWSSLKHWRQCVILPDSRPIRQVTLQLDNGEGSNRTIQANVLREEPLVLGIKGLAKPEECDQLIKSQEVLEQDLVMAFVSGGSTSKHRRTLSKNLYPDLEEPGSMLSRLHKRFFQVARGATGFNLWPPGQEPVNWLHYKPGYEYRPHCDGGCGQSLVPSGMRVASSLLYCNVPEQGGSTIFTKDSTKMTPARGDFLFFTYKSDPDHMSTHAACPVLKGIKSTATQWYREGVSEHYTWEDVNDLGYRAKGTEL